MCSYAGKRQARDTSRDASGDTGRDMGRDMGGIMREAGGGGRGEAVEGDGLCRKVGLGEQRLSFNIPFLATLFLLLLPLPHSPNYLLLLS